MAARHCPCDSADRFLAARQNPFTAKVRNRVADVGSYVRREYLARSNRPAYNHHQDRNTFLCRG